MAWLTAFLLTVLFETPVLAVFLPGAGIRRSLWYAFIVNLISHPLLWFVMPLVFPPDYYVLLGETSVVFIEIILLRLAVGGMSLATATVASFFMHLVSMFLGELLYAAHLL
jgi:hypothetical protein